MTLQSGTLSKKSISSVLEVNFLLAFRGIFPPKTGESSCCPDETALSHLHLQSHWYVNMSSGYLL